MYNISVPFKLNDKLFYKNLSDWLIERNVRCRWDDANYIIVFYEEEDAVAFRLRFGL